MKSKILYSILVFLLLLEWTTSMAQVTVNSTGRLTIEKNGEGLALQGISPWIGFRNAAAAQTGWIFIDESTSGMEVFNVRNGDLRLGTNNADRVWIKPTGSVGINTDAPEARLHIANGAGGFAGPANVLIDAYIEDVGNAYLGFNGGSSSYQGITFDDEGSSIYAGVFYHAPSDHIMFRTGNSDNKLVIKSDGKVGIGTTTPDQELTVTGDISLSGQIFGTSDARLKKEISGIRSARETINQLNPVQYRFRADEFPSLDLEDEIRYGLLAQEVEAILPSLVRTGHAVAGTDGQRFDAKSLNYTDLIPFLIRAIQEQDEIITELRAENARIDDMESQLAKLSGELAGLKADAQQTDGKGSKRVTKK